MMPKSFVTEQNKYLLCIPFVYAIASRYGRPRDFLVNLVTSWVPGIILVATLTDGSLPASVGLYFVGYIIFICIYEIGYMANDSFGLRHDPTPRARVKITFDRAFIAIFVTIRIATFLAIAYLGGVVGEAAFWVGYASLSAVLVMHNTLRSTEFKFLSFLQLSVLRFSLPVLIPLIYGNKTGLFGLVALVGIFTFVYPRFLTYLDAKDRLHIPERKNTSFLLISLAITSPFIAVIAVLLVSWAPIFVWAWLFIVQSAYVGIRSIPALARLRTAFGLGYEPSDPH